jgi:hypothetical protein
MSVQHDLHKDWRHNLRQFFFGSLRRQLVIAVVAVHAVMMSIFVAELSARHQHFVKQQLSAEAKILARTLALDDTDEEDETGGVRVEEEQGTADAAQWVLSFVFERVRVPFAAAQAVVGLYSGTTCRDHGRTHDIVSTIRENPKP